ncbi:MAG: winged helix-turn-helix transcriptional regulator [Candidatus Omnitrophica bacterium]|nr:winged helix-turn-helix transcriptional regulator [Candidatus Omnitrophota bacterium]
MNQLLKADGLPLPEYQVVDGSFVIRFKKIPKKTTSETTQEMILRLVKNYPQITRKQLSEKTEVSSDGVKYHLDQLRKAGKIRHVGSTKKGHWQIL